jgi:hypothetical protein
MCVQRCIGMLSGSCAVRASLFWWLPGKQYNAKIASSCCPQQVVSLSILNWASAAVVLHAVLAARLKSMPGKNCMPSTECFCAHERCLHCLHSRLQAADDAARMHCSQLHRSHRRLLCVFNQSSPSQLACATHEDPVGCPVLFASGDRFAGTSSPACTNWIQSGASGGTSKNWKLRAAPGATSTGMCGA